MLNLRVLATATALCCTLAIFGFNSLGYFAPNDYWSVYGTNAVAIQQFAGLFDVSVEPMPLPDFIFWLRMILALAWVFYVGLLAISAIYPAKIGREIIVIAFALTFTVSLLIPPWLSSDIYSYIIYGRMFALHGLNPYIALPSQLGENAAEPFLGLIHWDLTSRYGPMWTMISGCLAVIAGKTSVVTQILVMKLIAAVSQCALAVGVARLSALVAPRWQQAAFVLIAFSPLFITEGPGNSHNDTLMLAFVVWGCVFWQQRRFKAACLMLGVAGSIKFIPFGLAFWFIGRQLYMNSLTKSYLALLTLIAIAPFLLLEIYFFPDVASLFAGLQFAYSGTPAPSSLPDTRMLLPFLLVAFALSFAVISGRLMHWTFAWTFLTFLAIAMIGPAWPWYLMWPGIFIFAGYSRVVTYAIFPYISACFFLMYFYSVTL